MFLSNLLSAYVDRTEIDGEKYYLYEEVWSEYAQNFATSVFLYTAIALVAVALLIGILVKLKKPESFQSFLKVSGCILGGFVVTVIITMLALGFAHIAEKGYAEYSNILGLVLVPSAIAGGVAILGFLATVAAKTLFGKAYKPTFITSVALFGAAVVALLVCLAVYFATGTAEENNGAEITVTENIVLYLSAVGLIAVLAAIAFIAGKNDKKGFDSKSISYAAVCIASSYALSYIKFFEMPQGGSLTLASLLPLMIYSYIFGTKKGVIAGAVYGVLQAIQDPWLIHPAQFLLDYPVAFAAIGVAGMFAKIKGLEKLPQLQFALGAIVASVLRFASHVLSGVFAFSEYSTLDNVWIYSMGYNSFVFVDIAITVVVGIMVFSVTPFVKQVRRLQTVNTAKQPEKA